MRLTLEQMCETLDEIIVQLLSRALEEAAERPPAVERRLRKVRSALEKARLELQRTEREWES
ncbi:MAG: hypothetical protein KatS3mg008_0239 [Acidimicrobiales bacterium]|nr:MAG: hypothetical protein KatS3mg008_0239 [Acidimicrobiales bacterium]